MTIKRNAMKCLRCGEIIESKHHWECVWCSCKSLMVDGGTDYLRRGGDALSTKEYEDLYEYEKEATNERSL